MPNRAAPDRSGTLLASKPGLPQYRSNLATAEYGVAEAESALGRVVNACASWLAAANLFGDLNQEGKLRPAEKHNIEELRTRLASCQQCVGGILRAPNRHPRFERNGAACRRMI